LIDDIEIEGSLKSAASALVFIMAMAMYPEIQVKAQAEIDAVLKGARLPEMADRSSMPYIQCMVKEVFRWKSVVPLGAPLRYNLQLSLY
jgi:cytochrome P450